MEKIIAKELLSIGAVFLRPDEPFTWASGIKSPIYCDNRLTLSAPSVREKIDFIFIDLPPVEMISDATIVHTYISSYVLIVRMRKSDYQLVQGAIESIEKVGGKIAGLVLNDVEDKSESYRYKSKHYGRYGRYYKKYYSKYGSYISGSKDAQATATAEAAAPTAEEAKPSETEKTEA